MSLFGDLDSYQPDGLSRSLLEGWLKELPPAGQIDLQSRLQSKESENQRGALFELVLHALFMRLDCSLEIHPATKGTPTRPDFLVHHGEEQFYLEATSVGKRQGPFTRNSNEENVIKMLEKLTSPYFDLAVDMEHGGKLLRTLGEKDVCPKFATLLGSYRHEEVRQLIEQNGTLNSPSESIKIDGWSLTAYLSPRSEDVGNNRRITIQDAMAKFTNVVSPLRESLKDKSKKYGKLDRPFVLAVNASDMFYNGKENDMDILFGDLQIVYGHQNNDTSPKYRRDRNGLWLGKNNQVDAVLMFQKVDVWNFPYASACLYLNPSNTGTALPNVLLRLPHAKGCQGKITWFEGEDVATILGIRLV